MNSTERYVASTVLPVSRETAFAYHARPGALERLIPPWESVAIESSDNSLQVGSRVVLKTRVMGVPLRWVAQHTQYEPPDHFADTQLSGPFAAWNHLHRFTDRGASGCDLSDQIDYKLPGSVLGAALGGWKARATIESMFAYRHRVTLDDLRLTSDYPLSPKTIAVSGANGLVGSQLCNFLSLLGHSTKRLVRSRSGEANGSAQESLAVWSRDDDVARLDGVDAVIHLAGKSIADKRWSDSVKQEIRDSRVILTRQLCERLARLERKPSVLVCASATGIYGSRGDEVLDETSRLGDDFLASVGKEWEAACKPAIDAGIRVVHVRFGIILTPRGGALAKMLTPAKLFGGALGNGRQWWSWIALDDVLGAIYHVMARESIHGPVNFVSPNPMRNADFAKELGSVLGRPALLPAPAFALRLGLGEMADSLLLASTRVMPNILVESGYRFRFPELRDTLRYQLGVERRANQATDAAQS